MPLYPTPPPAKDKTPDAPKEAKQTAPKAAPQAAQASPPSAPPKTPPPKDQEKKTPEKDAPGDQARRFQDHYVAEDYRDPKKWGRRIADKLGPILERIVGVLSSGSIHESMLELSKDIEKIVECESVRIYSVDRRNNELYSRTFIADGVESIRWAISKNNLAGYAASTGNPIYLKDLDNPECFKEYPDLKHDPKWDQELKKKTRTAMVVPLFHTGKLFGVIEYLNRNDELFDEKEFDLVQEAARKLGQVMDKLEKEDAEVLIKKIAISIHRSNITATFLVDIKRHVMDLFKCDFMTLFQVDSAKNEIFSKVKEPESAVVIRVPIDNKSIAGWVAKERRMVSFKDVADQAALKQVHPELEFDKEWDRITGNQTKSILVCPLLYEGTVLGVLQLMNKTNEESFTKLDEKNSVTISELLGIALNNQQQAAFMKPSRFSYLVNNGIISPDELNNAIVKARSLKQDVEDIMLEELKIERPQMGASMEEFYKIPYFGYNSSNILPKGCLAGINKNWLIKNYIVPVSMEGDKVVILIHNPNNLALRKNIENIFSKKTIEYRVGLRVDILDYLNYSVMDGGSPSQEEADDDNEDMIQTEEVSSLLSALQAEQGEMVETSTDDDDDANAISEKDSTIVRLVNKIIIDAYDQGVSDIHIEPGIGKAPMRVRFRKDGECDIYQDIPHQYKRAMASRFKIISKLDIAEKRLPQDGKIKMKYGKKEIELRVATLPTVGGNEDLVLRILAASKPIPLVNMGFSARNLELLKKQVAKPYGIILVVGPTGSGKTTTLHSALAHINTPARKIWTAEDPVEITQAGLRQMQMHTRIGLDFARAMRAFLRADPDVIMVGEMRDQETCAIGIEASLTGHLVFSTLHTNSAPETITRLLDMGMNPINFADALLLILAQRLGRTLCKKCKEDYHLTEEEYNNIVDEYGRGLFMEKVGIEYTDDLLIKKAVGCEKCGKGGYAGRMGLHELLEGSDDMKRMIMKKSSVEEMRAQAIKEGMTTLKQDGIAKIFGGACDLQNILAVCIE